MDFNRCWKGVPNKALDHSVEYLSAPQRRNSVVSVAPNTRRFPQQHERRFSISEKAETNSARSNATTKVDLSISTTKPESPFPYALM